MVGEQTRKIYRKTSLRNIGTEPDRSPEKKRLATTSIDLCLTQSLTACLCINGCGAVAMIKSLFSCLAESLLPHCGQEARKHRRPDAWMIHRHKAL